MVNIVEEQKKRIRHMYSFMFRRYRTNTLANGGSISDKPILGPELIPDASRWFNIDNDPYWSRSGSFTISGGIAKKNVGDGSLVRFNLMTVGKLYQVTFNNINPMGVYNVLFGTKYTSWSGSAGVITIINYYENIVYIYQLQ